MNWQQRLEHILAKHNLDAKMPAFRMSRVSALAYAQQLRETFKQDMPCEIPEVGRLQRGRFIMFRKGSTFLGGCGGAVLRATHRTLKCQFWMFIKSRL